MCVPVPVSATNDTAPPVKRGCRVVWVQGGVRMYASASECIRVQGSVSVYVSASECHKRYSAAWQERVQGGMWACANASECLRVHQCEHVGRSVDPQP